MSEFVKAEEVSRNRVKYTDSSGRTFIHSKGTWAWRNNNPGNIRLPSKKNMPDGVIVKRQNGYIFLRSRPDNSKINNLDK